MAEVIVNVKANTGQATNSVDDLNDSLNRTEQSADDLSDSLERQEARIKTLGGAINVVGGSVELLAGGLALSGALTEEQVEQFESAAIGAIAFADGAKRVFEGYKELSEGIRAYGGAAKVAQAIQARLNLTILANPYVAAAAAIAAVTAAVYLFISSSEDEEAQLERARQARERYNQQLTIEQSNRIALLRATGATAVQVAKEEEEIAKQAFEQAQLDFVIAKRKNQFSDETAEARLRAIDLEGKYQIAQANTTAALERQAETEKIAAEREAEQRKRLREQRTKDAATLAEELADIQREAELALLEERDREISIATETYNEKLALLQENGEDTTVLTEAFNQQIAEINQRYDKEEADRRAAAAKEQADADKAAAQEYASFLQELQEAGVSNDEERKALDIQRTNEYYDDLIAQAAAYGLDTEQLEVARQAKLAEIEKQGLDERTKLQKAFESDTVAAAEATLATTVGLLATIRETTDDGTKEGFEKSKKFRIAETRLSSIQAAFDAYKSLVGVPFVGPILAVAAAAAALAAGQKAINDIQNSSFTDTTAPSSPVSNTNTPGFGAGLGGGSQTLTQTTTAIPPPEPGLPMRAYVVSSDINSTAATESAIRKRRTL